MGPLIFLWCADAAWVTLLDPGSPPPLLKHDHWAVRRSAAESIGRLRYSVAAADVKAALERESDTHALADELIALVLLRHADAKALCAKYRQHADPFVRSEAERASKLLGE